jgi:CHAD domain-containing protein
MANPSLAKRETERKYETDEHTRLPDPARLLGSPVEAGPELQRLEATYYDTADLGLLRSRITLRRREGGHDAGWHLKLPAGADSREEIQVPLDGPRVPQELVGLTRLAARGQPLAPVAQLNTVRRRWVLRDSDGAEVAELVEDDVHAHTVGAQTTALAWREVEVELGGAGRREVLDRIEHKLMKAGVHRSDSSSKLARVLADRLAMANDDTGSRQRRHKWAKAGSAGAVVLNYLHARAEHIRSQDLGVRRDTPDAVHQMRVGAREMRSALRGFGRVLDREATWPLAEELKWLGGELAPARDSEVIEQRLVELVNALPAELVLGPVATQITREMARRGREGRQRALAALDSDRYLRLHQMIDDLFADPPLTRQAARGARKELPKSVAAAYRRTAKRMDAALALEPGQSRDLALHEARKAAKRLRYATELAAPAVGKKAKRLSPKLKNIHKLLGTHQDAVVARPVLRELAVAAHLERGNGFTYGLLHGAETRRTQDAERELPTAWAALGKGKNLRWLAR